MADRILIKYNNVELCQQEHIVLKDVNLEIKSGEFIFLLGKVGSGKSTFLKSLYAEIPVIDGDAYVLDYDLLKIKRKEVPNLRRKIGIVFQDFQLLIDRSINANLEFVLKATGWKDKNAIAEQIHHVLKQVGMQTKGYKMPHQLSGGEQQRIVIARALLNSPEIILADEPTGNLDEKTGKDIMDLLYSIRKSGTTVLVATHNLTWMDMYPGRVLECKDEKMLDNAEVTISEVLQD
ncbi:MAG: ATP-binding cassette domain-containing protein [Paludibacteraceae bacterium]|jgi:cell division transport system ATP-binding protein|nr:ATP-binding cassette domain-containing protein [Paludibacteraceae bacterium]